MTAALLALGIVLLLTGCQLARADGGAEAAGESDRLIGILVTREYLDLFDFERYVNDHLSDFGKGGEVVIDSNPRYEGRIYAELKSELSTNVDTGEQSLYWEYVFKDLDGITFFCAYITQPDGNSFWGSTSDDGISDGHLSVGNGNTLEGTLYVVPGSPTEFYVNPVHQSADGRVYVTAGSGYSASGNTSEGSVFTQTLTETETVTENGEITERKDAVTIHIAVKYPTERVRVIQMDDTNTPVAQKEYTPERLPEQITPDTGAAYLIIESRVTTPEGPLTRRVILNREDNWFSVFRAQPDGLCVEQQVRVEWE